MTAEELRAAAEYVAAKENDGIAPYPDDNECEVGCQQLDDTFVQHAKTLAVSWLELNKPPVKNRLYRCTDEGYKIGVDNGWESEPPVNGEKIRWWSHAEAASSMTAYQSISRYKALHREGKCPHEVPYGTECGDCELQRPPCLGGPQE